MTLIKDSLVVRDVDDILVEWMDRPPILPENCDVVIIGGGVIGSSIAYWLKQRIYTSDFKVVVVEKDPMVSFFRNVNNLIIIIIVNLIII